MGFTIQLFCPQNDSTELLIIERVNWTGVGAIFPREQWQKIAERRMFSQECVYILLGYEALPGLPEDSLKIYIGQTSNLAERFNVHRADPNKDFWERTVVFTSSKGLNKAHVLWLEQRLIKRANEIGRCIVRNGTEPRSPDLSEADRCDMENFLTQMLETLPVVGIQVFEKGRTYHPNASAVVPVSNPVQQKNDEMVIVVPAQEEGFRQVFLGENCWYAVRIAANRLDKIKYIAAYQSSPVSAVTHFAPIKEIVPYGDDGKYKIIFSSPAQELQTKIIFDGRPGTMQGIRYTTLEKLLEAKKTIDLDL